MTAPIETAAAAPPRAALWEDFVDIFTSPSKVFERRRDGRFAIAMVVYVAAILVLFFALRSVMQPIIDAQMDLAIAKMRANPDVSAAQIEKMRGGMEKFASVGGYVGALIGTPIMLFLLGGVVWLISRLFDAYPTYSQAMVIAVYSQIPRIVGTMLGGLLGMFTDPSRLTGIHHLSIGPGHFVPPDASPIVGALAMRFDLFTIWATILIAIGVSVIARVSRGKGAGVAAGVWLVATAFGLLSALRQTMT